MTSLFISYARKDVDYARRLTEVFKGQEFDFWIDWEGIPPTVDWWNEVKKGIEQAGVFLFLVSPDSIRSRVCRQEIDHAIRNGKRLIPIVIRDVKVEDTPTVLSHLNWIFIRESDDFDTGLNKLITAIKTDYDWVQAHRDLQIKALEWERSKRGKSFLLSGEALQLAEFQLTTNASKEPHPTDLQREYLLHSRQKEVRQRRILTGTGIGVAIILTVLTLVALFQANRATKSLYEAQAQKMIAQTNEGKALTEEAAAKTAKAAAISSELTAIFNEEKALTQEAIADAEKKRADSSAATAIANEQEAKRQAKIAFSRQLAAEAQTMKAEQFDLAFLLAIEASRDTSNGQLSLSNLLRAEPQLIRIVSGPKGYIWNEGEAGFIDSLAFNTNGTELSARSYAGTQSWELNTLQPNEPVLDSCQEYMDTSGLQGVLDTLEISTKISTLQNICSMSSNRAAFSACRTMPSAGGAPGCASLIYIFATKDAKFENLVTTLPNCSVNKSPVDFQINLEGGLYHITNFTGQANQPANFDLYSATLENKSSNNGSQLVGALYDPQTNQLATAASYGRFGSQLALTIWDLTDNTPIMELYYPLWEAQSAAINFSSSNRALDICVGGSGIQIDIDPKSWQTQACKIAGRNFTQTEWNYFFDNKAYQITCPEWPAGE